MELGEIATAALLLAVIVVSALIGGWLGRGSLRVMAARVTDLEREVERLAVEVARIDSTALLWQPPPDLPAETGS